MKLHYKIISHSSQEPLYPVTNLVSGSGMWQSGRFCEYPQQITIQFYDAVTVTSIHVASHPVKIASKVHVLFCLEDGSRGGDRDRDRGRMGSSMVFQKFGYFQFGDRTGVDNRFRELKKLEQININATHMRLIIWKNHQNSQNFFNQVGLSQLAIYANPYIKNTLPPVVKNKSGIIGLSINDYIEDKLQILEQFKHNFSKQDDFQSAKKIKQIIKVIKVHGERLKILDAQKKIAVGTEQYQKAKQLKSQMQSLRNDIEYVINNFYDPNNKQIKPILKDNKIKAKFDEILSNSQVNNNNNLSISANQSRVSNKLKKVQMEILGEEGGKEVVSEEEIEEIGDRDRGKREQEHDDYQDDDEHNEISKSKVSYDNRIIPTILHKSKKQPQNPIDPTLTNPNPNYQDNEFLQKPQAPEQLLLEQMTPSAEVNAAVLLELYDKEIVKKLHSKHWSFKLEALGVIYAETRKWLAGDVELEKNKVKSVLFCFNRVCREGNFQLNSLNLDLLAELVGSTKPIPKTLQTDLHADLQKSLNELFLKMPQSQKIKQKCEQILLKMQTSPLYGTNFIYQTISKSYFNQVLTHNVKIKKYKLGAVESMVMRVGVAGGGVGGGGGNGKNGLPIGAVEFMCKVAEDSNDQIRKLATGILKKMKDKGVGNRVIQVARSKQSLKGSIIKQLQA